MLQARLDRRFVARSMERGRARFSPRSDVYAVIRSVHRQLRAKEAAQAGGRLGLALPTSTRTFYNQRFDAAQERISPLLEAARIPERFKARARALYGFRLRRGATLGELLSCDVYATQTYNMDFPLELALAGLSPRRDRAWGFNATHVFLHRPQHSVFIYLHEILVGDALALPLSAVPPCARAAALPFSAERPLELISEISGVAPEHVYGWHFADTAALERALPQSLRDLMLAASHLFWSLELLELIHLHCGTVGLLIRLMTLFTIPALERLAEDPRQRMAPDVGRRIDRLFSGPRGLLRSKTKVTEPQLVRALEALTSALWVPGR